uniref:Wsv308-like protein n=1 Tax=Pasiphaea japonica whispovirus TaxID=2984286 RepID=A0A9C7F8M2_9VIRU|nr:MAG: wsv308-like protein [Pasiphaea japonica whispovirus]
MATQILEEYIKNTASSVIQVAEAVEKLKGVQNPEEAAALAIALYGTPPKPSAANVAVAISSNPERSNKVLMDMSVARVGQENNRHRVETAIEDICGAMEDVTGSGFRFKQQHYHMTQIKDENKVYIQMVDDHTPQVAAGKYVMETINGGSNTNEIGLQCFRSPATLQAVKNKLKDIFANVQQTSNNNDFSNFVSAVANNGNMGALINWADKVENIITLQQRNNFGLNKNIGDDVLYSRNAGICRVAVKDISQLVGVSYCVPATQLTLAEDIMKFKKAADVCFDVLMSDTIERIITNFLFYVNFKVVEGTDKEKFVKERLASMSGLSNAPITIIRRSAQDTLFGMCYLFKVLPTELVACILNFPTAPSNYGVSGTCLASTLTNYGTNFDKSWVLFNNVIGERLAAVKDLNSKHRRLDSLDATANLTGPVYVLVLDLARTFSCQKTCSDNFLHEIREQYLLWNKFVEAAHQQ